MLLKRSKPPLDNLTQWNEDLRGRVMYQDDGSVNMKDAWFMDDNQGDKLRPIQPGRGYNFTGVEYVQYPNTYNDFTKPFKATFSIKMDSGSGIFSPFGNTDPNSPYPGIETAIFGDSYATTSLRNQFNFSIIKVNNSDAIKVHVSDYIVPGTIQDIEVEYDGSKTAAGISIIISGEDASIIIDEDDLVSNTISRPYWYLAIRNGDVAVFNNPALYFPQIIIIGIFYRLSI